MAPLLIGNHHECCFSKSAARPGAEGRGGKQGPGPPLKYSAPVYIYN